MKLYCNLYKKNKQNKARIIGLQSHSKNEVRTSHDMIFTYKHLRVLSVTPLYTAVNNSTYN